MTKTRMLSKILDSLVPPSSGQRFPALDGLRGIAAMAVVLRHIDFTFNTPLGKYGGIAVCVFFSLSAFLLYYPWVIDKPPILKTYYVRRFWRIVPAYLVAILLGTVVQIIIGKPASTEAVFAHFFFAHSWVAKWTNTIVPPTWSLCTEVQFYVLLPLIALFISKRRIEKLSLMFALGVIILICSPPSGILLQNLPVCAVPFLAGMIAAHLVRQQPSWGPRLAPIGAGMLLILGQLIFTSWADTHLSQSGAMNMLLTPRGLLASIGSAFLIMGLATNSNSIGHRILIARPVRVVGIAGYGIFLLHYPLISLISHFAGNSTVLIFCPVGAILLGVASFIYLEAPALRKGNLLVKSIWASTMSSKYRQEQNESFR